MEIDKIIDNNAEEQIQQQVLTALENNQPLAVTGGNTKAFYGLRSSVEQKLEMTSHSGVISYEPTELVMTARAGTPLSEVQALLDKNGQQFAFEPPAFGEKATIGGMVATGLCGPRRGYDQSVRDAVLGVKILNGKGEILNFGGQVMKNVAGYDVSRLMVGSLGTLAVILEASIRVAPVPSTRQTVVFEISQQDALRKLRDWSRESLPITASAWIDGHLYARLCGVEAAVDSAHAHIGGEKVPQNNKPWEALREHQHPFFTADDKPLWRLSVAPSTPELDLSGEQLIEWGGALRWVKSTAEVDEIRETAHQSGGHATLFRYRQQDIPDDGNVFMPPDHITNHFQQQLKQAFDPRGIFNPGRLYRDM